MKKLLALTLALVLTFSALSVVSFAAEPVDISTCTVEEVKEQKHTGSAITPDLVVKTAGDEPTTLVKDTDYTVEFKNNTNYGTASYTITGKGNYTGTKTGTFEIVPNTPVDGVDYLDTDTKSTKDIDQKYDATVTKNYTDVNKVQVSWTIPDIIASVTINKKWNTKNLSWDTTSTTDSSTGATAEFNFVNFSSVKVKADVAFTAEAAYANAEGKTDKYTESYKVDDAASDKAETVIDSIIADRENAPETVGTTEPTAKIEYTITPQSGAFTHLTEAQTDAKFGTYTVTIADASYFNITPTFVHASAYTGTDQNPFANPVSIEAGADSTATLKFKANANSKFLGDTTEDIDDIKEEINLQGADFVSWSVSEDVATLTIQNPTDDVTFNVPGKRTINNLMWKKIGYAYPVLVWGDANHQVYEDPLGDTSVPTFDSVAFVKLTSSDTEESVKAGFDATPAAVVVKDEDGKIDYVLGKIGGKTVIRFYDEDKTYASGDDLFYGNALTTYDIDFDNFSTKYTTRMYRWFNTCQCSVLDLSNFDTSRVICMIDMFFGCSNLTMVDLSSFDMSHITSGGNTDGGVTAMFGDCYFITAIFAKENADWFVESGFKGTTYNPSTDSGMFAFHNDCYGDTDTYGTRFVGIPNYAAYDAYNESTSAAALNLTYANTTKDGYLTSLTLNHVKLDLSASSVTIVNQWNEAVNYDEWQPEFNACIPSNITIKFVPEDGYALPATMPDGITGVVNGTWTVDANGVGTLSCKDITADFAINLTATAK